MIYQVKKDIILLDQTIPKHTILNFDESDVFIYKHSDGTTSSLRKGYVEANSELFHKVEITETEITKDDSIKRYRIQLDINCKQSDLIKIQKMIESNLTDILN